jgi:arginase
MKKLAVIGVPSSAGARRTGQDLAPRSFRDAGLIKNLKEQGLEIVDLGDLDHVVFRPDTTQPKQQNLDLVCATARRVATRVAEAIKTNERIIILGGDCTITIGVIAGMIEHHSNLGLMYFDGDVDLNTPETTTSGIFDGMVVSHIRGDGAEALARVGSRYPLLSEECIVLFGYNPEAGGIDPPEAERLEELSAARYPIADIRGRVVESAIAARSVLEERADQLLVHFDVDVIDSKDFPAADVLHHQGLSFDEAMAALSVFAGSPKFAGLVVTEFNSERDKDGSLAVRLVDGIVKVLGESASCER